MIVLPSVAALRVLCCLVAARGGVVTPEWLRFGAGLSALDVVLGVADLHRAGHCIVWRDVGYQLWEVAS